MSNTRYFLSSFGWTTFSKFINAGMKFVSIPLLISYFGKEGYGLITLALSINAYVQLMDMGMNTGIINFFSNWISTGNYEKLNRVFKSNLTFYTIIGFLNALILVLFAFHGRSFFNISTEDFLILKKLLFVLAVLSIFNWVNFVFTQLLISNERIAYTQKVLFVKNILSILNIVLTITLKWSLTQYLICEALLNSLVLFPYYLEVKKVSFINKIYPSWYWQDFKVVFYYGLAIFAMSVFQFSASQSRPLILATFVQSNVTSILSDYKVLEVFPVFIISIGGSMISIFLPKTSRALAANDNEMIKRMAYNGTRYTSIVVALLCFPVIINSADLLELYVGKEYRGLSIWLIIWIFTLISYLYNSPISSLVLSTGKTRMLVFSSAISCVISIVINSVLAKYYGVGSAIIGYAVYIGIQMSFYYLYFNNKVLGLDSLRVFKNFAGPTGLAMISALIVFIPFTFESLFLLICVKSLFWVVLYALLLFVFKLIDYKGLIIKIKNR